MSKILDFISQKNDLKTSYPSSKWLALRGNKQEFTLIRHLL